MNRRLASDRFISWIFLIPTFIALGIVAFIPLVYSIWLSFQKYKLNMPHIEPSFAGFANYTRMFGDYLFVKSTTNTVVFALVSVSLEIVLGLVIAMLVSGDDRWSRWLRVIFLIPMVLAPVVAGTLWRMMLDRSTGIVNYLLGLLHIPAVSWLAEPLTAQMSIIFVDVWRQTPWVVIILVSGLKAIPSSIIEAALVDGASPWQIFARILFHLLRPLIIIVLMMRFIDAFKVFDTVYVMTGGGPGNATEMLPNYIYNQGLKFFDAGYAAALAWVFILFMSVTTLIFMRLRTAQEKKLR